MNEFSNVGLQLAGEVLAVCEEAGIPCILADECVNRLMNDSEKFTQVYLIVKTDDLPVLFQRLQATAIPNRAVESMQNNDWYPDFSMRYVDTGTTCYYENTTYRYDSIGVFIVPLRRKIKRRMRLVYDRLEHWNLGNGRRIYPKLLQAYKLHAARSGIITSMKWKRSIYATAEFSGKCYVSLEDTVLPISQLNPERGRFAYRFEPPASYALERHAEPPKPDEAYVNSANPVLALLKYAKAKVSNRIWKRIFPVTRDWHRIHCVNERDLLRLEYEKKKPLILELYKNKDRERLVKELRPYHKKLVRYYRLCKLTIVFDREIFEIYKEVYGQKKGKMSVRKLTRRIPAKWRTT